MSVYPYGKISVDVTSMPTAMGILTLPALPTKYIYPLEDDWPTLDSDPEVKLQPPVGSQTSETTRFTRRILLLYTPVARKMFVSLVFNGSMHYYLSTATTTYHMRYYVKFVKTKDFVTFTDLTGEVQLTSGDYYGSGAGAWYDGFAFLKKYYAKLSLDADDFLLLNIRGTSWADIGADNGVGINSTNFKLNVMIQT
ncbi:MAG: hypothetical protein NDF57_05130 [archaeon GBS-70-058]|nr:hypothetical protein [Candidatus Culexarchaeum nevadense]